MNPNDVMRTEQELQLNMLLLKATYDATLTDKGSLTNGTIINYVEVISDEAVFTKLERYQPQTSTYIDDSNMYTLKRGVYFGYFKDIELSTGTIRIASW